MNGPLRRSAGCGRCRGSAQRGSAAPISAPAFTRMGCRPGLRSAEQLGGVRRPWNVAERIRADRLAAAGAAARGEPVLGMTTRSVFRSCLYVGSVVHRRLRPRVHHFRYRVFWLLLDLDELPQLDGQFAVVFSQSPQYFFACTIPTTATASATPLRVQVGAPTRIGRDRSCTAAQFGCSACRGRSGIASIR